LRLTISLKRIIAFVVLIVLLGIVYYPLFFWMLQRYIERNTYYSYALLVPFVAALLIASKVQGLKRMKRAYSYAGVLMIVAALAMRYADHAILHTSIVSGISIVIALIGVVYLFWGKTIGREVVAPLSILVFMVPIPKESLVPIVSYMQHLSIKCSIAVISFMRVPIVMTENTLYLSSGTIAIDSNWGGMRYLVTLIMVSVLVAYMHNESAMIRKAVLVMSAVPIVILANIVRLITIIMLSELFGVSVGTERVTIFSVGLMCWILALLIFLKIRNLVYREKNGNSANDVAN